MVSLGSQSPLNQPPVPTQLTQAPALQPSSTITLQQIPNAPTIINIPPESLDNTSPANAIDTALKSLSTPTPPPLDINSVRSIQIEITTTESEIDRDAALAHGNPILDSHNQPIKQMGFEYTTYEAAGKRYVALPMRYILEVEVNNVKQKLQLTQYFYTTIEAPLNTSPSAFEKEEFKNKLLIMQNKIRDELSLEKLQKSVGKTDNPLISVNFKGTETIISTSKGFTQEAKKRKEVTRERASHGMLDTGNPFEEATISSFASDTSFETPFSIYGIPKNFQTFSVVPKANDPIVAAQKRLDDFKQSCAQHQKTPQNKAIIEHIRQEVTSLSHHFTPPENIPDGIYKYTADHALNSVEELANSMKRILASSKADPTTLQSTITLVNDTQAKDFLLTHKLNKGKPFETLVRELETSERKIMMRESEIQTLKAKLDPPATPTAAERTTLEGEKTTKEAELAQAKNEKKQIEDKKEPDPQGPTNKEKIDALRNELGISSSASISETLKQLHQEREAARSQLSVLYKTLKEKYTGIEHDLATCRALKTLYPLTPIDSKVQELENKLNETLNTIQFDDMGRALHALGEIVAQMPPSTPPPSTIVLQQIGTRTI